MTGLLRRQNRIFHPDGRTLVMAYDHGLGGANTHGMADPGKTLPELIAAGADSVLTTTGLARRYARELERVGLVVSLDSLYGDEETLVREAVLMGADMGKIILPLWNPEIPDAVARVRRLAAVCHAWEFPIMIETIPVSFEAKTEHTPEKIAQGARLGCEIGADLIKMHYTGDPDSFRAAIAPLYAPVVILGGPNRGDELGVLQDVYDAIQQGASGITIGRNIWMHERPAAMVAALAEIIHGNATAPEAARQLK